MTEAVHIETELGGLYLRELTDPADDSVVYGLFEVNRDFWQPFASDILDMHPDLQSVKEDRMYADEDGELRLGIWHGQDLVGLISVMDYSEYPEVGNWLGIWMDKNSTGQGLATFAARAAISYIQSSRINRRVSTTADPDNASVIKLLERVGFTARPDESMPYQKTGHLVFKLPFDGEHK